ncbi:hypothetical protein D3C78_1559240 [compost metagenome]
MVLVISLSLNAYDMVRSSPLSKLALPSSSMPCTCASPVCTTKLVLTGSGVLTFFCVIWNADSVMKLA